MIFNKLEINAMKILMVNSKDSKHQEVSWSWECQTISVFNIVSIWSTKHVWVCIRVLDWPETFGSNFWPSLIKLSKSLELIFEDYSIKISWHMWLQLILGQVLWLSPRLVDRCSAGIDSSVNINCKKSKERHGIKNSRWDFLAFSTWYYFGAWPLN